MSSISLTVIAVRRPTMITPPPNKALQLTRRRRSACDGPPGGRSGGRFAGRPPDVSSRFTGGAQLSALSVGQREMRFTLKSIGVLGAALAAPALLLISFLLGIRALSNYYAHKISPDCDIDIDSQLAARIGEEISFLEFTNVYADEVRIYGEYASVDAVRASGLTYNPPFSHVPEGAYVVAYFESKRVVCATLAHASDAYHLTYADQATDPPPRRYRVEPGPSVQPPKSDELSNAWEKLDPALRRIVFGW